MPMRLEIVSAERAVLTEDDVDQIVVPSADGQLTILPRHASLVALLQPGELRIRRRGEEQAFAISGGFMEVHRSHVRILADAAEHTDEIDVQRAQEAEERARALLSNPRRVDDLPAAYAALRLSQVRLRVARRRRDNRPAG
jgi:F-type H+-transporting ATPase subunit epsilon